LLFVEDVQIVETAPECLVETVQDSGRLERFFQLLSSLMLHLFLKISIRGTALPSAGQINAVFASVLPELILRILF
jgi:hypothetical protein